MSVLDRQVTGMHTLTRRSTVALLVLIAVGVGCEGQRMPGWSGTITESPTGATLVANPADGVWTEQDRWWLEDTLWIGAIHGQGPTVFGRITDLEVDSLGRMYVFDGQAHQLRVFGPSGDFISEFGRRGSGPGEFQGVAGMSESVRQDLWIVDGPNVRYTVLNDSAYEMHRRVSPLYRLPWLGGHAEGFLHDAVVLPGEGVAEVLVRVDSAGAVRDTFEIPEPELAIPHAGSMQFPLPYAATVVRAFDRRGYVWIASSHEYRLIQMRLGGDTARVITREVEAPPLTQAEADSVERYARKLVDRFSSFGLQLGDEMIPETAPLLDRIAVADDGSVWVTRAGTGRNTVFDVFDSVGRFLGEVRLDFPLYSIEIRNGSLYGVALGAFDVPRVFRAKIVRGQGVAGDAAYHPAAACARYARSARSGVPGRRATA